MASGTAVERTQIVLGGLNTASPEEGLNSLLVSWDTVAIRDSGKQTFRTTLLHSLCFSIFARAKFSETIHHVSGSDIP